MSFLQSSLRKESEVSQSWSYLICHALTLLQLQRHPRGTLRPLWQVRPRAVRRLPCALAHLARYRRSRSLTPAQPDPPRNRQQHQGHSLRRL